MGASLAASEVLQDGAAREQQHGDGEERRVLVWLLANRWVMFLVEIVVGWIAQSAGLIADSLDMLADPHALRRWQASLLRADCLGGAHEPDPGHEPPAETRS